MVKKALLVGVSEYLPLKANLRSATIEVENWKALLVRTYAFGEHNVRVLMNERATKRAVLDRLTWLLAGALEGDQIVFVFCGHGLRARRRNDEGKLLEREDEGLIPYPAGSSSALDVSIFDDDLTDLYERMGVRRGALPTFIFDCCYSAGIDFSETHRTRLTRPARSHVAPSFDVVRFGLRLTRNGSGPQPVVIAASGETGLAIEVEAAGQPRSLFSLHALDTLRGNPRVSYSDLITTIKPLMTFAAQEPCIRGDCQRTKRSFLH